ncbi:MAG: AP2 domain-containing protein [Steroidobacteraceae bacterium]
MRLHDLTGQRFSAWMVIRRAPNAVHGQAQWLCRCDCGTERVVLAASLIHSRSSSCGCRKSLLLAALHTKHQALGTPEHNSWRAMRERCLNQKHVGYPDYGGRGITVCDRWANTEDGFAHFLADMGPKPGPGYSIDRIDNARSYEPGNCRWATAKEQVANQRPRRRRLRARATCSVDGCSRPARTRGLCTLHYWHVNQQERGERLMASALHPETRREEAQ